MIAGETRRLIEGRDLVISFAFLVATHRAFLSPLKPLGHVDNDDASIGSLSTELYPVLKPTKRIEEILLEPVVQNNLCNPQAKKIQFFG